jgi:hypothetical protein
MEKNTGPALACSNKGLRLYGPNSNTIKCTEGTVSFIRKEKFLPLEILSTILTMAMGNIIKGVSSRMRGFGTEGRNMERGPGLIRMVRAKM